MQIQSHVDWINGERAGIRTLDLQIKSPLLYQLSYALSTGGSARKFPAAGPGNCGGT